MQLMSAGSGVLHGEMFPLLDEEKENPLQLFQIWINLPAASKMSEPNYKMLWSKNIPIVCDAQAAGKIEIKVILGEYYGTKSDKFLENSWAANPENHVGMALVNMEPPTEFQLNAISPTLSRFVFIYEGYETLSIEENKINKGYIADLNGNENIVIKNNDKNAKILILEGEPINQPVVAQGPFVMNTEQEIKDAFQEFRKTQFGGWPWGIRKKIGYIQKIPAGLQAIIMESQ